MITAEQMRVGLHALGIGAGARPEVIRAVAIASEAAGFNTLWAGEHVVLVDQPTSRYPYSDDGRIAVPASADWLDPLLALSFAAAVTETIGLATGVLLLPEHNPVVSAKQAATLDVLSGGRLTLGVGIGWSAEEFHALGVPFTGRARRTAEYVAAMRTLWADDVASFSGEFTRFESVRVNPKPVRSRRIPVVLGGNSDAALARVAAFADGWYGFSLPAAAVAERLAALAGQCQQRDRSPRDLSVAVALADGNPGMLPELAGIGVTELVVAEAPPAEPAAAASWVQDLAAQWGVIPRLQPPAAKLSSPSDRELKRSGAWPDLDCLVPRSRALCGGPVRTMLGQTCLVTGATSGIGKETAMRLAMLGATVIIVARDAERGETAGAEISSRVPLAQVEVMTADLSSLAQVRTLAGEVLARRDRLDVVVNNAGVISTRRQMTADGLETTFATNHLGPFLLTSLLRGLLERSAPARVVTVSSAAHKQVRAIPWDDLAYGARSAQGQAYPLSKLLNILFTAELARRLAGTGVTANCLHPGFVRTALGRDVTGVLGAVLPLILRFQPGPATGAETPVYLASSPEVAGVTGGYFVKRKPARPSALARDVQAAARLWALSEDLVGRTPPPG